MIRLATGLAKSLPLVFNEAHARVSHSLTCPHLYPAEHVNQVLLHETQYLPSISKGIQRMYARGHLHSDAQHIVQVYNNCRVSEFMLTCPTAFTICLLCKPTRRWSGRCRSRCLSEEHRMCNVADHAILHKAKEALPNRSPYANAWLSSSRSRRRQRRRRPNYDIRSITAKNTADLAFTHKRPSTRCWSRCGPYCEHGERSVPL
jgi:hypothetical protein